MTDPVSATGPIITSPIVQGGAAPVPVESPIVEGNSANTPIVDPAAVVVDPAAAPLSTDPSASDINKQVPDAVQKRINEITAKRYEAERTAKTMQEELTASKKANAELLAKLAGNTAPTTPPATSSVPPNMTEEEFNKLVEDRATQKAEIDRFNNACDLVASAGKKEFPDWDDAVKNLTMVGALGNNVPLEFLQTAVELKNPAKILHHLSKNLEEAGRIVKMPPTKMAVEMARIEAQLNAPAPLPPSIPLSQAPAPVIPVGGAAKSTSVQDINDPNISTADWMALRAKAEAEKRNRYLRA